MMKKYIAAIIICLLLAAVGFILCAGTSGADGEAVRIILAAFSITMLFGAWRGVFHIVALKREAPPRPTFEGAKYNPEPVAAWKVVASFFNPLGMRFRTVLTFFGICCLWVGMEYFHSHGFKVALWIALALTIVLKAALLLSYLRLNKGMNELGRLLAEDDGLDGDEEDDEDFDEEYA